MTRALFFLPLALLCAGFACNGAPSPEAEGERSFGKPRLLCELDDPKVAESSGVAASRKTDGVWYTHNDSGDRARFYRFNERGQVTGEFTLKGATAFDWEDMASAEVDGNAYLYFADIGDNLLLRSTVTVYRVEEPTGEGRVLDQVSKFVLKYPDGRHDAEAFMVRPETGDFYVVTKSGTKPAGVYKVAAPKASGTATMERLGEVQLGGALEASRQITGGDVSPDGKYVLLRTYLSAYEFEAGSGSFDAWVKAKPQSIEVRAEVQGEAIAYTRDGKGMVTTSETVPCRVSLSIVQ